MLFEFESLSRGRGFSSSSRDIFKQYQLYKETYFGLHSNHIVIQDYAAFQGRSQNKTNLSISFPGTFPLTGKYDVLCFIVVYTQAVTLLSQLVQ